MSYTKRGPFVNASPTGPWVDADFFNNVEAALVADNAVNFAPVATGVAATDTANLQAAITAAQTARTDLFVPGGSQRYMLTSGLTWDLSRGSLIGAGQVDLDFTALTSGTALEIIGSPAATSGDTSAAPTGGNYYSGRPITHRVDNFRLQGPGIDGSSIGPNGSGASSVDGVIVHQSVTGTTTTSVEPAQGALERIFIRGFRDGLVHGFGSFCIKHDKVFIQSCWRRGINLATVPPGAGAVLGENISFVGCTTSGMKNSTGTGVAVYTDPAAQADANFFACSFDYSDIEFDHHGGDITLAGCHIENNSTKPFIYLEAINRGVQMTVLGTSWNMADGGTRDHVVEVRSTSTADNVTLTVAGGSGAPANNGTTFFVNNAAAVLPAVTLNNFALFTTRHQGTNAWPKYGDALNLLYNGAFEDSTAFASSGMGGWAAGAIAGVTHTIGTANAVSGNALTITGTGTAGTDITHQWVPLNGRHPFMLSADFQITAFTAGSFQIMVGFYTADRATLLSTFRGTAGISAVQGYQTGVVRMVPPRGAAFADVQLQAAGWNGTVVVDNVQALVI